MKIIPSLLLSLCLLLSIESWALERLKRIERLEWSQFKKSSQYHDFVGAIKTMRANDDPNDSNSWLYWANIHEHNCPHRVPYFLAWHRGYLYLFEKKLQELSGNHQLRLPYWDYYANSHIPPEFTTDTDSPLYMPRSNTNVYSALSLAPFEQKSYFERGASSAFETAIESRPHNPVHNLIGNLMLTMQSPQDPIFWLHHANIDRLWSAWAAAEENSDKMPSQSSPYWEGEFIYTADVSLDKSKTIDTESGLNYTYDNLTLPTTIAEQAPPRPPLADVDTIAPRSISPNSFSMGGGIGLSLGEDSLSVSVPVGQDSESEFIWRSIDKPSTTTKLLLKGVRLTEAGMQGGYFYTLYLNLPQEPTQQDFDNTHFVGTLGAFEIQGIFIHHKHHAAHTGWTEDQGIDIEFDISEILPKTITTGAGSISVSFIRSKTENATQGEMVFIQSFEITSSEVDSDKR